MEEEDPPETTAKLQFLDMKLIHNLKRQRSSSKRQRLCLWKLLGEDVVAMRSNMMKAEYIPKTVAWKS